MMKSSRVTCPFTLGAILFLTIALLMTGHAFRLKGISVPNVVRQGSSLNLTCSYDLGDRQLYTLKWIKDGSEFYRLSNRKPYKMIFPLPGIVIDEESSHSNTVVLLNVSQSATGRYSCEVSIDATFQTKTMNRHMTVTSSSMSIFSLFANGSPLPRPLFMVAAILSTTGWLARTTSS